MLKTTGFLCLSLILLIYVPAGAVETGDPDSEISPLVVEPEANVPVINDSEDNPDAHADDANNIGADNIKEPLPGAHLVAPEPGESQNKQEDKWQEMKFARLQGLNKVTARTSEIKANIGANTKFGNLEFNVEKCLRGPENEKIENTVLLKIWDEIPGQEKKEVFHGWMFSSSPAISALEHPIYDIILLGCGDAPKAALIPAAADPKKDAPKKPSKKTKASITVQ